MFIEIGKQLLEASRCSELLTLCAVYIFKYSKEEVNNVGNETFLDVVVAANKSSSVEDLEALQLARKLCIKAMMHPTDVDERAILEVLHWIDSCYYLSNMEDMFLSYAEVHRIYLPSNRSYYFGMSFEVIRSMFNMYCSFAGKFLFN